MDSSPSAMWSSLPAALRDEIDDLLCQRKWIMALRTFVERAGTRWEYPLKMGKELLSHRNEALYEQGRIPPEPETTVADVLAKVASLDLPPVAIEACWDGDYRGWLVDLLAIVRRAGAEHPVFDEVRLATLHWRRDSDVAPEEEALAKGQAVADRLGVPFYFAKPHDPGLDHRRWWDT